MKNNVNPFRYLLKRYTARFSVFRGQDAFEAVPVSYLCQMYCILCLLVLALCYKLDMFSVTHSLLRLDCYR